MFARPNNKVMTAALTRSYERTVQSWVVRRTAAVSMKQTSVLFNFPIAFRVWKGHFYRFLRTFTVNIAFLRLHLLDLTDKIPMHGHSKIPTVNSHVSS